MDAANEAVKGRGYSRFLETLDLILLLPDSSGRAEQISQLIQFTWELVYGLGTAPDGEGARVWEEREEELRNRVEEMGSWWSEIFRTVITSYDCTKYFMQFHKGCFGTFIKYNFPSLLALQYQQVVLVLQLFLPLSLLYTYLNLVYCMFSTLLQGQLIQDVLVLIMLWCIELFDHSCLIFCYKINVLPWHIQNHLQLNC